MSESISGWNFTLAACLKHARNKPANLASAIAVSELTIERWQRRDELPSPRAVKAMKKYLAARDAPVYPRKMKEPGPRGVVGHLSKREKPAMKLRRAERPRYGFMRALFGPKRTHRERTTR